MNFDDLKIFLPKYLTAESEKELFESLKQFPNNIDQRIYTKYLQEEQVIFQGDGLRDLLAVNLPKADLKKVQAMVLSNTCDIEKDNKRNFPSQIIYAPIINLDSYIEFLRSKTKKNPNQIRDHVDSIKKQFITQIFYLPKLEGAINESIVFLDRLFNISNDYVERSKLKETRLFTLSDFGNYLFLYKLSIHFTRIQDKVERKSFFA